MPLYEFKCSKCEHFFEILVMSEKDQVEMKCPQCNSEEFERVLSTTSYLMGNGAGGGDNGVSSQTRTCSGGSCTTYDIPGPNG
jgi:putative FmdB family regulatory protein